jgi:hypothetical protein
MNDAANEFHIKAGIKSNANPFSIIKIVAPQIDAIQVMHNTNGLPK